MWRYLFLQQVDVSPHKDDLSFSIREESSRRRKKERGRKLRRYLLIGLATLGGGTVIGDYSCFRISKSPESNDNQLIIKSTKTKEKLSEFSSWQIVALTSFCILYWLIYLFFCLCQVWQVGWQPLWWQQVQVLCWGLEVLLLWARSLALQLWPLCSEQQGLDWQVKALMTVLILIFSY